MPSLVSKVRIMAEYLNHNPYALHEMSKYACPVISSLNACFDVFIWVSRADLYSKILPSSCLEETFPYSH